MALSWSRPATAIEYEVLIDIDDEEELNELRNDGQINDSTYETLIELLRRGTDLNRASREDLYALPNLTYEDVDAIIAYREEAGRIGDPADLVVAGVLSRRKLASLAAFLLVPADEGSRGAVHGFVRYRGIYVATDPRVPPMALQSRVTALGNLTVGGAALLDPQQLGPIRWDPNRGALMAEVGAPRPRVPKLFAQWDTDRWQLIAGTYRVGFGQGLTLDNSRRYTPNGLYLDDALVARYDLTRRCRLSAGELVAQPPCGRLVSRGAPGFRWSPGFKGVAATAKRLPLPVGWLQATGFWSMQEQDVYQYRVYDRSRCEDPEVDDVECSSPPIYVAQDDPLAPTRQHIQRTIPRLVDIITQGANLAWYHDERTHVGVTGFGSIPRWRTDGVDLDFRPASRFPRGGAFGAVGADFSWGYRWADIFGEVSRSFDSVPTEQGGGGDFAGILRHTASWDVHELEVSARYYAPGYANPYSSPISARDRFNGNQGRDEAGGRVRYTSFLADRVSVRTFADFWVNQNARVVPKTRIYGRADVDVTQWWRPGLWLEYQSNDLRQPSFKNCLDPRFPDAPLACGPQRFQATVRSRFQPIKRLYFMLQYRHEVQNYPFTAPEYSRFFVSEDDDTIDVEAYSDPAPLVGEDYNPPPGFDLEDEDAQERLNLRNRLRNDMNTTLMVVANPVDPLRLRARFRWYWDDIVDNGRLEHFVWSYLEAQYKVRNWFIPSLRYDFFFYVDERDSTADRRPNPEHWIRLQLESRF